MAKEVENTIKEIGGTNYVMKMIPTMAALSIATRLESGQWPPAPELIFDIVTKGASIGSVTIDAKKFDSHFAGKLTDLMQLMVAVLKHNKLVPDDVEEGNEEGSEE